MREKSLIAVDHILSDEGGSHSFWFTFIALQICWGLSIGYPLRGRAGMRLHMSDSPFMSLIFIGENGTLWQLVTHGYSPTLDFSSFPLRFSGFHVCVLFP